MRPRSTFAPGRAVLAASVLLAAAGAAAGPKRVSMLSKFDQSAVERARAGAARKLQEPECQRVLEDFRDGEGRPLRQSLDKCWVQSSLCTARAETKMGKP